MVFCIVNIVVLVDVTLNGPVFLNRAMLLGDYGHQNQTYIIGYFSGPSNFYYL